MIVLTRMNLILTKISLVVWEVPAAPIYRNLSVTLYNFYSTRRSGTANKNVSPKYMGGLGSLL